MNIQAYALVASQMLRAFDLNIKAKALIFRAYALNTRSSRGVKLVDVKAFNLKPYFALFRLKDLGAKPKAFQGRRPWNA